MAAILATKYAITREDGVKESGSLLANAEGLYIGVPGKSQRKGLKKITTHEPGYCIVRWDDVTAYEITDSKTGTLVMGSSVSSDATTLTIKTATSQRALRIKNAKPETVRNQLGPVLAKIDSRI